MLLGDMLARLRDPAVAAEMLVSLDDLALAARVRAAAAVEGLTEGEYAARAAARFVDRADEEAWLSLIGQMARTPEPGKAFLRRMLADAG